jgi:hypothetical protein
VFVQGGKNQKIVEEKKKPVPKKEKGKAKKL